jgi:hypothetical protein
MQTGEKDELSVVDSWWSTWAASYLTGPVDEVEVAHWPGAEDYDTLLFYLDKSPWTVGPLQLS